MVLGAILSGSMSVANAILRFLKKYGLYVVLLIGAPIAFIWSLNMLFGMNLQYDFATWFSVVIFVGVPLTAIVLVKRFL